MEIEWTQTDPRTGERCFVRARKFARRWQFATRPRRRTNWQTVTHATREMWETLLEALERRSVRPEGVTDDDLAAVRTLLSRYRPPPEFDGPPPASDPPG